MKRVLTVTLLVVAIFCCATLGYYWMMPPVVKAQVNTFCASNLACTVTAVWTFTGQTNIKTLNSSARVFASQFSGTDVCAQITNAQAALPTDGGVVDALDMHGTASVCASSFSVGGTTTTPVVLLLGPIWIQVPSTVTINPGSKIIGLGSNGAQGGGVGSYLTRIIAANSFPNNTVLIQFYSAAVSQNSALEGVELDCASITGCTGIETGQIQENARIHDVLMNRFGGNCLSSTGPAENFVVDQLNCVPAVGLSGATHIVLNSGTGVDHVTLRSVSLSNNGNAQSVGVSCNAACNVNIQDMHIERTTDGVLFTGAGSGGLIDGLDGFASMTNLVHIASSASGQISMFNLKDFGNATNIVKDDERGYVCTDAQLAVYLETANGASTPGFGFTSCKNFPAPPMQFLNGAGGYWQAGQQAGSSGGADTFGFFSNTYGAGHSSQPILQMFSSDGSVALAGVLKNAALTATMGLTFKSGAASNYTGTNTTYAAVDTTNLCAVITVPTGWKLNVEASGVLESLTAAVAQSVALADAGATCTSGGVTALNGTERTITPPALGVFDSGFHTQYVLTGDGNPHSIALVAKTSNAADGWGIQSTSVTVAPSMRYLLMPSN